MASTSKSPFFGRFLLKWMRHYISVTLKTEDLKKAWNLDIIWGVIPSALFTVIIWRIQNLLLKRRGPMMPQPAAIGMKCTNAGRFI